MFNIIVNTSCRCSSMKQLAFYRHHSARRSCCQSPIRTRKSSYSPSLLHMRKPVRMRNYFCNFFHSSLYQNNEHGKIQYEHQAIFKYNIVIVVFFVILIIKAKFEISVR